MNICLAGHKDHKRKIIRTVQGDFIVYSWQRYMGFPNYCTGQDEVSKSLDVNGKWDMEIYDRISKILDDLSPGAVFVDIGCHIGWFSALASKKGAIMFGYDGDMENIELARTNVPNGQFEAIWLGKETQPLTEVVKIDLMKIDIEGNEQFVLKRYQKSLEMGTIKNIIMEISPVFNDSYPAVVKQLEDYGFQVFTLKGEPWDHKWNFDQTDLLFKKI